jgi:hypothetical protein
VSDGSYLVACDFGLQHFDRPRAGAVAARLMFAEVRRLGRLDDRVGATRMRRTGTSVVSISVVVDAPSSWEAFDLGRAILRTAVHATGGATVGWENLRPQIQTPTTRRWGRFPTEGTTAAQGPPDWAAHAATARRHSAAVPTLPPLQRSDADRVIDLR